MTRVETPEQRAKRNQRARDKWANDAEYRQRTAANKRGYMREYYQSRKANDPDFLARLSEQYRLQRANDPAFCERRKEVERANKLKREYNISIEQYETMLEAQGGGCAICHKPPTGKALAVDHCHETGKVRGLLCTNCNSGIGKLGDTEESLMRALEYLRSNRS